jgi:hypothetical protein
MTIDWPTAFVIVSLFVATFVLIGWQDYLRAGVMKEAIRNGADHVRFD